MMRKLRVLTREYRHKISREKTKQMFLRKSNIYNHDAIVEKLERLEGNDIVSIIRREIDSYSNVVPIKEIHVTGRIAKKLLTSDKFANCGTYTHKEVGKITGVPVVRNNKTFDDLFHDESDWIHYRRNPTGEDEWMKEIRFIHDIDTEPIVETVTSRDGGFNGLQDRLKNLKNKVERIKLKKVSD